MPGGEPSAPLSRFDPFASLAERLANLLFRYVSKRPHPAGTLRAMTGCGPESARIGAGGIDLQQAGRWGVD
jgi:hypothetical protein